MRKNKDGYYRESFSYKGKRYDVTAKSQRDLWRKVDEKKRLLESGMVATNGNTPVHKWMQDYLETYKKKSVTPRTYDQLASYLKNYINPAIGNIAISDVRPIDLQKILNSCAGKSSSHARKLRDLIRGAFRQARIDRVIIYDPAESLSMPETTEGTHRPITESERAHILNVCKTHRAGLWVLFMLNTGARPAETRAARWEDVDFANHVITLHSAKTDFGDRRVPCPDALYQRLKAEKSEGYIFTQPTTGMPHTKTSMRQMWETFKKEVDIDMGAELFRNSIKPETSRVAADLSPYCLRHTYATDLQSAGVPINIAKEFLGHKNISMTSRVYTKLTDKAFNDAKAKVLRFEKEKKKGNVVKIG